MTLHVVQVGAYADPQRRKPEALLAAWPTLDGVAQAVAGTGVRVSVVQAAALSAQIERGNVTYRFVRVPGTQRGAGRLAAAVAALDPDVVHLNGLGFPLHARALARALPATPLFIQDHADRAPRGLRLRIMRRMMPRVHGSFFTAAAQAAPFLDAGIFARDTRIIEVPESSTHFTPGDRAAARKAFGVDGHEPVVAWVGRLSPGKDPLRALEVFRRTCAVVPDARLLCAFTDAPLLEEVEQALAADARLAARVTLLGRRPHAEIEMLLRAADIYLSTSLSEGSGYALVEALASGVTPVVTDIPSYRTLTADGTIGRLFPAGDTEAGVAALVDALHASSSRERVRRHFDMHLSFDVIGRTLSAAYASAVPVPAPGAVPRTPRAHGQRRRVVLLVPGGVDRSGTTRVIPCVLALIERLARTVDLHVLALRQEDTPCSYPLLGSQVECVPSGSRSAALRALLRLHREQRIDVLHALWMHPQGTTAALAGTLLGVPVLLHLNGGDVAALPDLPFGGRATRSGRLRLRLAVAGARRVTAPSDAVLRQTRALGIAAERLTLGAARDRWPERAPRSRPAGGTMHLLSVADLRPVKDHATLLRAVAGLVQQGRAVQLDCIGFDTMGGAVQRLAADLGLQGVVHFHDVVPHAELRARFDAANALVVSSRYEGDPVAALEAAIAGVPVIGTAVGHLVEWAARDAALVCPPGDDAALAAVIARIMDDEALRLRLARNAQRLAAACDADAAAARVVELYDAMTAPASERRWIPAPV